MNAQTTVLAVTLAFASGALGCAAGGDATAGPAGGKRVRCTTVLETRPGPGGVGTQTVPVQKCEPYEPPPPRREETPPAPPGPSPQEGIRR